MEDNLVNYKKFDNKKFISGVPFPHIVIDGLFDNNFLFKVEREYPKLNDLSWWEYSNHFEKKLAYNNVNKLPYNIQKFFRIANSWNFVKNLEKLTDINFLISDPSLNGGGLHMIEKGGKLDIHADFNYHKETGWRRRLNMITFLNKDWKESYGGHIEFWDKDMARCAMRTLPAFNRTVIFTVDDDTWHGHPDPLTCPDGVARISLATYYYTHHNDDLEKTLYRSTNYKKRPDDPSDENIEKLRSERRKGRLEDLKT